MDKFQETPLTAFYQWEKAAPSQTFLRQPVSGVWRTWTYQGAGEEARKMATALKSLGMPAGSHVAILSKNCAHWLIADLAIMMAGFVSVPVYPTLSAQGIRDILEHSDARAVFLGKLDDYDAQRPAIASGIHKISFPFYGPDDGLRWTDLLQEHPAMQDQHVPDVDTVASIMYSSGTTGTPKGVMLTFGGFGYVGCQVKKHLRITQPQRFFSYLPLSHIAERALMEMVALSSGSSISFAESIPAFQENLRQEQPTIFGGVPRIFAKFQEGILKKIPQRRLDLLLSIPGVDIIIKEAIIRKLGLSRASVIVCGAAPTPVHLLEWFNRLGIEIRETYGMTENTAYSHSNFRLIRNGTVGQAWPEVDVKCDDHGEVLVRHKALMKGYYKDAATTASVMTTDGFLRTGDQGMMDAQGFLTITGRVKDQFKTEKAKFVAPAPIELKLSCNSNIDQVCVVGSGLAQPIALMTLTAEGKAKARNTLEAEIRYAITTTNQALEKYEHIQLAVIMQDGWSIENGLMTPSLKIRRNAVEQRYSCRYREWIATGHTVVWEHGASQE